MDRRNEGEALSVTRFREHRLRRIVAGGGVFGVNGLGLALRGSSNNTLITFLGILPPPTYTV